ncbi:uncharacterized protein LOC121257155 isoform X1 [Juglans microcarpa x Juglans regia]|uniref:uncharacterized protein LOC121257155 isoform X1 n=2 Tax=Juglans microcarpa x Juglans regia TaxID=2249226 RepID=UPI001B7DAD5B|nr:uncharacterized protein LOC121257155 isoform X1 [Juglans microcarpa x Juglans regia]
METDYSSSDLQRLLEAIKSSDVVESRVELLTKLRDLEISDRSDLHLLMERLTTYWEDFTCLDASQCLLNKSILHVAVKHLESDISGCLSQFLSLGTKASIWCGKHLKMILMSNEGSQEEEHDDIFFQLLLDLLRFSAASFSALATYHVSDDEPLMDSVENYISEQLNLTKNSIAEVKRIGSLGSEVVKAAQIVIDAVIRLCRVYSLAVNRELCDGNPEKDESCMDFEAANSVNHVSKIAKCTIEKLCELGILAANDGGSLVTILNVSWKGVVTLLQLGKGALSVKVKVADIILALLSLVNESLRCAAKAWSSSLKEAISVTEARRIFVPVKFYLINAVKISFLYPSQAYLVYREITLCILIISTLKTSLSDEELMKTAGEVITELLEQTSMDLLKSLVNSAQLKQELKLRILDWLFINESNSNPANGDLISNSGITSMEEIFSVGCEDMTEARTLLLGRVTVFLNLLKYSLDLDEDVKLGMISKLGWFFDILVDEEVYSSILALQIPELFGSQNTVEINWQPMFSSLLHALETFMIVLSSSIAWGEFESFLLENFFHPHFLCQEIVIELWCFMVRHAEISVVNGVTDKLSSLLRLVASSESVFIPGSAMRKVARSLCMILSYGTQSMVDHVYNSIIGDNRSQLSAVMHVALFMEGFPLNLLSERMRNIATQRIFADYFGFLESFDDKSMKACSSSVYGVPVFALSASLQSLQLNMSDSNAKTLKFMVAITHNYRNSGDQLTKDHYRKLLSETLGIIANNKHLYAAAEMEEVILELENLFISGPAASDTRLHVCKPHLALFMAGLGHMEMTESDTSAKCSAIWELYHMLLREQHWALIHLAITAFGYFAARTSCNQLWRFVPQTAALSYDLVSGNEANEERFMSELKAFLEKERALLTITPSSEQLGQLVGDGLMLKRIVQNIRGIDTTGVVGCESMETDENNQSKKKRKLPDEISEGVELLQNGLKVIGDGFSRWQQDHDATELRDNFMAHISRLEDEIAQLVGLAGSG